MFKRKMVWLCAVVLVLGCFVLVGCGKTDFNGTYTGSKKSGSKKIDVTTEVKKGNLEVSLKTYSLDDEGNVEDDSDPITYQYSDKYKKDKSGNSISIPEDANGESVELLSEDGNYYLIVKEGKKRSFKIAMEKGNKKGTDKADKNKTEKVKKEVRMATILAEPADSSWDGEYTGKDVDDPDTKIKATIDSGDALIVDEYDAYEGKCLSVEKGKEIFIKTDKSSDYDFEMKKFAGKIYLTKVGGYSAKYEMTKK